MVGRAAHETAMQRGPRLQGLAPLHHLGMVARELPAAVDAPVRALGREGHCFGVFVARLEIVQRGRRTHRVAERPMLGDVVDQLPSI
jgi:hypothetical protein